MAYQKFDLVQETSTSTGTGAMALGGAVTRRRTFSAVMSNGDTCYVLIEHGSAAEWEICLATYNTSGNTLSRGTVAASSTGSAVSFSAGSKTITLVGPASKFVTEDPNGDATVTRHLYPGGDMRAAGVVVGKTLYVSSVGSTKGYATLFPGGPSNAGGVSFNRADTTRTGYVGWGNNDIHYMSEIVGGAHVFKTTVGDAATISYVGVGVGMSPITSTSKIWSSGDLTFHSTNHAVMANLYYDGGWKYTANGAAAAIKLAPTTSIAVQFLGAANNAGGAGAAALPLDIASFDTSGHFLPGVANARNLGSNALPWGNGWIQTAWTVTSTAEMKTAIREPTDAERRVAARIAPKLYKLTDAVALKGEEGARWHTGYVAEDVRDAFVAEGLDPWRYGILMADPVMTTESYTETVQRAKTRTVELVESVVEIIGGQPTLVSRTVSRVEPVGALVDVVDEAGNPVMVPAGKDAEGNPVLRPLQHLVPEMETVEQTLTREVPLLDGNGDPVMRLGLRYSELEAFLRCADVEG